MRLRCESSHWEGKYRLFGVPVKRVARRFVSAYSEKGQRVLHLRDSALSRRALKRCLLSMNGQVCEPGAREQLEPGLYGGQRAGGEVQKPSGAAGQRHGVHARMRHRRGPPHLQEHRVLHEPRVAAAALRAGTSNTPLFSTQEGRRRCLHTVEVRPGVHFFDVSRTRWCAPL